MDELDERALEIYVRRIVRRTMALFDDSEIDSEAYILRVVPKCEPEAWRGDAD